MQYRLGIVLSGGGTRGIAHVGVLEAMRAEGIEPDCLAATSAGAIVAALYAAGHPADAIVDFFETRSPFRLSKLSLAKPGFFDTEKVVADFAEFLPNDSFEALDKKLFLTATDIIRARPEVFASGPLIRAVIASSTVPAVFTPTEIDGTWFADGGITNNFPVEPLLGLCDVILGVYASPLRQVRQEDLKSSLAVTQRAFEVGMYYASRAKFHQCDLVICPEDLSRFGTFDQRHHHEIYQVGYDAARERMETIRRLVRGPQAPAGQAETAATRRR